MVEKDFVLRIIDEKLKNGGVGAKDFQELAEAIISAPDAEVEESEVETLKSVVGVPLFHYCKICKKPARTGDVFCSGCGRILRWKKVH